MQIPNCSSAPKNWNVFPNYSSVNEQSSDTSNKRDSGYFAGDGEADADTEVNEDSEDAGFQNSGKNDLHTHTHTHTHT